ncbi:MAG TPA: hypothetical protein VF666_12205 [Pyrinomonadaceae bacterium]|jgi:hypothetical protein
MASPPPRRTQTLTIIAQDPSVKVKRKNPATDEEEEVILTARVDLPAEELAPGPRGYRVQIIDYDSTTGILYPPLEYRVLESGLYNDPFIDEPDSTLLNDPLFHAQNVYAIVMRTLARFEFALGRRVSWSFNGHQLLIAPHAFTEANAFYSSRDRAVLFGYFPKPGTEEGTTPEMVFTCLSHDIVVHETTHALLDGLRERYMDPSSPEQAGFHEGFADIVALLSIFSLPKVVASIIDKNKNLENNGAAANGTTKSGDPESISLKSLTREALRQSLILGLAEEFGEEMSGARGKALRRSVEEWLPDPKLITDDRFLEPHMRGELLVAAVMNAFIEVWVNRLKGLGHRPPPPPLPPLPSLRMAGEMPNAPADEMPDTLDEMPPSERAMMRNLENAANRHKQQEFIKKRAEDMPYTYEHLDRQRVVEEGANIADYLLTMVIRALDYTPPSDIQFCDFLSAMLTADREIRPDDSKYKFRKNLLDSFKAYGMEPTSKGDGAEAGVWEPPDCEFRYNRIHLESLIRDKDEMFRFIWENRTALGLEDQAYTRVLSVRPCVRVNPDDGFTLRETVAEYHQIINLQASEMKHLGIKKPPGMRDTQEVVLYGGGALIFDEFGRVKFHIRNRLLNPERQTRRLEYLWEYGAFKSEMQGVDAARRFSQMHRKRFGIFPIEGEKLENDNYVEKDHTRQVEKP